MNENCTIDTTYDINIAEAATASMNARRKRRGFSPSGLRYYQKSVGDNLGERYDIHRNYDGDVIDVRAYYNPIF